MQFQLQPAPSERLSGKQISIAVVKVRMQQVLLPLASKGKGQVQEGVERGEGLAWGSN